MAKHKIALIGLGMAVTPHAKSLVDLRQRVEVVYAYSRTEQRRRQFAEQFDFPLADDLDTIIDDPSVGAVMILTPPNAHFEIAKRCASAGKHILLEKPIERTTASAEELVAFAEQQQVKLAVVFQYRHRSVSKQLKQLLDSGTLGELAIVNVSIPWWRAQSYYDEPGRGSLERDGGGVLISQAIHSLNLLLSLTGPVAEVSAVAGKSILHELESEDFVAAGLRFANGAMGALMATTAQYPGAAERIELCGSKASAVLTSGVLTVHFLDGREEQFGEQHTSGGGADPMAFPHDDHRAVLSDFIDAIEQDREPLVSGRDGLNVHYLIDALLLSAREKRTVTVQQ